MNIKQMARDYAKTICADCYGQDGKVYNEAYEAGARAVLEAARENACIPNKKSDTPVVLLASIEAMFLDGGEK